MIELVIVMGESVYMFVIIFSLVIVMIWNYQISEVITPNLKQIIGTFGWPPNSNNTVISTTEI